MYLGELDDTYLGLDVFRTFQPPSHVTSSSSAVLFHICRFWDAKLLREIKCCLKNAPVLIMKSHFYIHPRIKVMLLFSVISYIDSERCLVEKKISEWQTMEQYPSESGWGSNLICYAVSQRWLKSIYRYTHKFWSQKWKHRDSEKKAEVKSGPMGSSGRTALTVVPFQSTEH